MKNLKPVQRMADLEQFGIKPLTGEACTYSLRTLCDVSADGKALLSNYFGAWTLTLNPNWNSTVNDAPAVGSVMLAHSMVKELATFAFFETGALAICSSGDQVIGLYDEDALSQYSAFLASHPDNGWSILRNYSINSQVPHIGSRNVHAFTGRAQ